MKVISRHKDWVKYATITELDDENWKGEFAYRKYVATIYGFRGWKIYEVEIRENMVKEVVDIVEYIKKEIENNNLSIFSDKRFLINN
jgi:CRISPR/Cas system-associated exonuclease Cas4 (RecB family)